jgi:hypothetical protein
VSRKNPAGDFDCDRNGARYSLRWAADPRIADYIHAALADASRTQRIVVDRRTTEFAAIIVSRDPLVRGATLIPTALPGDLPTLTARACAAGPRRATCGRSWSTEQ